MVRSGEKVFNREGPFKKCLGKLLVPADVDPVTEPVAGTASSGYKIGSLRCAPQGSGAVKFPEFSTRPRFPTTTRQGSIAQPCKTFLFTIDQQAVERAAAGRWRVFIPTQGPSLLCSTRAPRRCQARSSGFPSPSERTTHVPREAWTGTERGGHLPAACDTDRTDQDRPACCADHAAWTSSNSAYHSAPYLRVRASFRKRNTGTSSFLPQLHAGLQMGHRW
jgi:hypothetical protein